MVPICTVEWTYWSYCVDGSVKLLSIYLLNNQPTFLAEQTNCIQSGPTQGWDCATTNTCSYRHKLCFVTSRPVCINLPTHVSGELIRCPIYAPVCQVSRVTKKVSRLWQMDSVCYHYTCMCYAYLIICGEKTHWRQYLFVVIAVYLRLSPLLVTGNTLLYLDL